MFAIVESGGQQYKCEAGKIITVKSLPTVKIGEKISFTAILDASGSAGAPVSGSIVKHFRDKKIIVFKKQRRTANFTKKRGHRQNMTQILIDSIG